MGQQQLLLVILVTIIVGIATVVAINIFGQASDQANRDAVRQDLMGAAAQAQAIWARPALMGGANRDFTSVDIEDIVSRLGIPGNAVTDDDGAVQGNTVENENAVYTVTAAENQLTITASPSSGGSDIIATVTHDGDSWTIDISDDDEG